MAVTVHTESSIGPAPLTPSVRWALAGLSLSMLMPSLDTSIANAGLPTLAHAFAASFQETQWIVLAYLLAVTTLVVSVGRLGDIVGRRRLLLLGISVFTVASLLCGVAPTLWLLIAARAAQGLGAAIMLALTVALAGETVPKGRTGSVMGLLGTMSAVGTTLGPSLGGVLIAGLGWRSMFLVNVPLGLLTLVLAYRHLPADRRVSKAARTGVARLSTFLPDLTLFRYSVVRSSLAMSLLVSTVMMATLVVGPFYLSKALGLETALVGLVLSVGPLVAALTGVPAGRIVDRSGAKRITLVGLSAIAAGSLALFMIPASFGIVGYITPIVVITSGYALFQAANNTAILMDIRPDQRGAISGMLSLSRNLGLITGASVMGAVFALASGSIDVTTADPAAIAAGMRMTFAVATSLIVAAIAIATLWGSQAPRATRGRQS
ncbi:MAG: MFS transporter [Gammaproteobacteria bacterium]